MKAQVTTAVLALTGSALLAAAVSAAPARDAQMAQKGVPRVDQIVVFRSGAVVSGRVLAKRTTAKVGRKQCGVAAATPLAALLRAKPGKVGFHDYGDCSSRVADSTGLFVKSLRDERNRNQDGWVYKVGRKLATAGAADLAGPFGNGRLRTGDDVVWFYCSQFSRGTCQRSLEIDTAVDGRRLSVTVTGYDDAGEGAAIAGATIHAGDRNAVTDSEGKAALTLPAGSYRVHAEKKRTIRSFAKRVKIG